MTEAERSVIQRIRDPQTREWATWHYRDGLSWRDVAQRAGGGNTADCIKKRVKRAARKSSPPVR